jgi:hypothetical protein
VPLRLVLGGLEKGLELVRVTGYLGLDGLTGLKLDGQFLKRFRGGVGRAGCLAARLGNGGLSLRPPRLR